MGCDTTDIMISDDGSWKAVMESNDNLNIVNNKIPNFPIDPPKMQGSTNPPPESNILDLTVDDDEMDAVMNTEDEDRKPLSDLNTCTVYQAPAQPDNICSRDPVMPITSNAGSDPQVFSDGSFEPTVLSNLTSPAIAVSVSPALMNQGVHSLGSTFSMIVQSQLSAANNLQLQQSQLINSIPTNEYGYGIQQPIPMNVTRTPITVQALSAPLRTPNLLQRSHNNMTSIIQNGSSTASLSLNHSQHQLPGSLPTPPFSFCQTTTTQV